MTTGKSRGLWIVNGILCIIAGILASIYPVAELVVLSIFFASFIMVSGIFQMVFYFDTAKGARSAGTLVWGIISMLLGAWVLFSPASELVMLMPYVFAFWIIMAATSRFVLGVEIKTGHMTTPPDVSSTMLIVLGIIGFILGAILLFNPIINAFVFNYLIAIAFFYEGIMSFIHFAKVK